MSMFVKSDAITRIRKAADAVAPNALGRVDVLDQIAAMQAEAIATACAAFQDEQDHQQAGAGWMRSGQLAKHIGVSKPQILDYLAPLVASGAVRAMQPKTSDGKAGHMRYNVADVERAWLVKPMRKQKGDGR